MGAARLAARVETSVTEWSISRRKVDWNSLEQGQKLSEFPPKRAGRYGSLAFDPGEFGFVIGLQYEA
jgi:hypothetical protein